MSTTAQDAQTSLAPDAGAQQQQDATAAASSSTTAKSPRSYTLFEEARQDTWTKLAEVEAETQEEALDTLGEQKLKSGQRFMAIPSRFVVPRKPKVTTVTSIAYD